MEQIENLSEEEKKIRTLITKLESKFIILANGKKLSWNIADYLASLENHMEQMLADRTK